MATACLFAGIATVPAYSDPVSKPQVADPIPARTEGEGPFSRLILRGAIMVDGTGGPAQGPVDIVIVNDRIAEVVTVGAPGRIEEDRRPAKGDREIDMTGYYVMPGFINSHVHLLSLNDPQKIPTDYMLKLWLINGITSVRELGSDRPPEWLLDIKRRSARNEITAPRIDVYPYFSWGQKTITTEAQARERIDAMKKIGVDGVKFGGGPANLTLAGIAEAKKIGLRSTMHHDQLAVADTNVLDTSGAGLESMEHWYGLPEAMFTDRALQTYSPNYIYDNEQDRFGEAGRLWQQAAAPGSPKWEEVMSTLLDRHFALSPTFVPYLASRDLWRMIRMPWQEEYTMPALWDFWRPNPLNHGSFWFDWTTEDEVAWRDNFAKWMKFVNEYKNRGGRVSVGDDAGYLYNLPGFGYVQELELLREAGFSSLEVIRAATQTGARVLGHEDQVGVIGPGLKADIIAVKGNPLANLKLLYPTGTIRMDPETGKVVQVGGIDWIIKDGIVYQGKRLRDEVKAMVAKQKAERGIAPGMMRVPS
ncbi:amidohydrolase family protein [Sphingomonas sp. AP4-R1]|nr:amidohydrolase family protein [Sphingomonas sp. AP4-R1]